jgi:hypothetical protein
MRNGPETEPNNTPYTGLLADLPPVHSALYDPAPPVWFIKLAGHLADSAASQAVIEDKEVAALNFQEEWNEFQLRFMEEFFKREEECLLLLCQHYSIDMAAADAGWKLASALARKHVPAFQLERAVKKQRERRAKKPTQLDTHGALCLFLCDCLDCIREKRALTAKEKSYRKKWNNEVQARGLAPRTISSLKKQLRGAHLAYWEGCASDFQRQFVEEVDPVAVLVFKNLGWWATPSP